VKKSNDELINTNTFKISRLQSLV